MSRPNICATLRRLVAVLDNPFREQILKALPKESYKTFDNLKGETGISTGGLYHQLHILQNEGFVDKTRDRPAKWYRTELFDELVDLAANGLKRTYGVVDGAAGAAGEQETPESDIASS